MNILFLTTHNLATNPRLYKEICLAVSSGYKVEIICFEFDNWSKEINAVLKEQLDGVKIIAIPAGPKPFFSWIQSVISEHCYRKLGKLISLPTPLLSQAVSRRSNLIIKALRKVSKPDWVVGHNLGALYATFYASQKFNCRAGFDVEDYHPGEGGDQYLQNLAKQLMRSLLLKMEYVSFAAPMIKDAIKNDLGTEGRNWITVMNYFSVDEFKEPIPLQGPLKMVWFSQNISGGRGLELILPLITNLSDKVELHLFGNLDKKFYEMAVKGIGNVVLHTVLPQDQLHDELRNYDVGLALDIPVDLNRDLVLTNKLLAYLQAGLFVFATNTKAQELFLKKLPFQGFVFDYTADTNTIKGSLEKMLLQTRAIREGKELRFKNHIGNNWESLSIQLINIWNNPK